jgi:hypothetical protein
MRYLMLTKRVTWLLLVLMAVAIGVVSAVVIAISTRVH